MRTYIFTIFVIITSIVSTFSFKSYSGERIPMPALSNKKIQSLSFNELQKLRYSYILFISKTEKDGKYHYDNSQKTVFRFLDFLRNSLLISDAYCLKGDMCFFGGWPSKIVGKYCTAPWNVKNDSTISNYGNTYNTQIHCGNDGRGNSGQFRCNPVLFGFPGNDSQKKGYCVKTGGTYQELTEKCEKESRDSVSSIVDNYKKNPDEIKKFSDSIKIFCDDNPSYDACDNLAARINEIINPQINMSTEVQEKPVEKIVKMDSNSIPVEQTVVPLQQMAPSPAPLTNKVLDKCQQILKNKKLNENERGIIESITRRLDCIECHQVKTVPHISALRLERQIRKISEQIPTLNMLKDINDVAFEMTIKALLASDYKFRKPKKLPSGKKALKNWISIKFPYLMKEPYSKTFDKLFDEIEKHKEAGNLDFISPVDSKKRFNKLANEINKTCRKIRGKFVKKFGQQDRLARMWDTKKEKEFFRNQTPNLASKINTLLQKSEIGNLLATKHFKDNIFDPGGSFAEDCAENPSYIAIKSPIDVHDVKKGLGEIKNMNMKNLSLINAKALTVQLQNKKSADKAIKEYLKYDANLVAHVLKNQKDQSTRDKYTAIMCSNTIDIHKSDRNWRYFDYAAAGVGIVAGTILIFLPEPTGATKLLGMGLTSACLGVSGYSIGRAGYNLTESFDIEKHLDNAVAQDRMNNNNEYFEKKISISNKNSEALKHVGLAVAVIPMAKVTFTTTKVARMATKTTTQITSTGKKLKQITYTGTLPKQLPPPITKAVVKTSTQSAIVKTKYASVVPKPKIKVPTAGAKTTLKQGVKQTAKQVPRKFKNPAGMTDEILKSNIKKTVYNMNEAQVTLQKATKYTEKINSMPTGYSTKNLYRRKELLLKTYNTRKAAIQKEINKIGGQKVFDYFRKLFDL